MPGEGRFAGDISPGRQTQRDEQKAGHRKSETRIRPQSANHAGRRRPKNDRLDAKGVLWMMSESRKKMLARHNPLLVRRGVREADGVVAHNTCRVSDHPVYAAKLASQ